MFSDVYAQSFEVEPALVVLSTKTIVTDSIYFLGENYYTFQSASIIDSVSISDENHFVLTKKAENKYCISRSLYGGTKLKYPSSVHVKVFRKGKKEIQFYIPVKLFPPVKIIFYKSFECLNDSGEIDIHQPRVQFVNTIVARAVWDYPKYVNSYWRFRGRFTLNLYANRQKISAITGWYDTGDLTNSYFNVAKIGDAKEVEIEIEEESLVTLHSDQVENQKEIGKLKLSPSTPKRILFHID